MVASILVIDDDEGIRELLTIILGNAGYSVRTAENGAVGLRLFAAEPADLVITDIFMPEKEGIETIIELRGYVEMPRIVAMSGGGARAGMDVLHLAKLLGAHEVMMKPFTLSYVEEVVRKQLQVQREDRALRAGPAARQAA